MRDYETAVQMGTWHEGIIVFQSGDVVTRFKGLFREVDRTNEAAYLSRAEVEQTFNVARMWWR